MAIENLTFVNDSTPQCDDLFLNSTRAEVNNLITNTGQSITTSNLNQLGIATAIMSSGSDFYTDSGSANTYVLSPVGSKSTPISYFNGMKVRFRVGNANTGASTVNVNSLGVKNIKARDGSTDPSSGDFIAGQEIQLTYDGTNFVVSGGVAYPAAVGIPTGVILDFTGTSAPSGYLLCYGQAISRTTYATLFGVIGTSYGIGDGSTTFNLPDSRGRVRIGLDNLGGSSANRITSTNADSLNNTGGGLETTTATGSVSGTAGTTGSTTLSESQIPSHYHLEFNSTTTSGQSIPNSSEYVAIHDNTANDSAYILSKSAGGSANIGRSSSTGGGGSHSHTGGSISASFTGSPVTSTQPWFPVTCIIKT